MFSIKNENMRENMPKNIPNKNKRKATFFKLFHKNSKTQKAQNFSNSYFSRGGGCEKITFFRTKSLPQKNY